MQRFPQLEDKLPACQRNGKIDIESNVIMLCMMHYITNMYKIVVHVQYSTKPETIYNNLVQWKWK